MSRTGLGRLRAVLSELRRRNSSEHTVINYGADLAQAYMRMEAVEHYAKVVLAVRQLGSPQTLGNSELEKLAEVRARYGASGR